MHAHTPTHIHKRTAVTGRQQRIIHKNTPPPGSVSLSICDTHTHTHSEAACGDSLLSSADSVLWQQQFTHYPAGYWDRALHSEDAGIGFSLLNRNALLSGKSDGSMPRSGSERLVLEQFKGHTVNIQIDPSRILPYHVNINHPVTFMFVKSKAILVPSGHLNFNVTVPAFLQYSSTEYWSIRYPLMASCLQTLPCVLVWTVSINNFFCSVEHCNNHNMFVKRVNTMAYRRHLSQSEHAHYDWVRSAWALHACKPFCYN